MNRKYTIEQFEESANLLREYYPNVILTTDIIVGFPQESNEEFEETFSFLKKIKFYKMHIFKYSMRNRTKAATMENQIPNNIKEERSVKLIKLSNQNQIEINQQYIGKELDVLFEERTKKYIKGHTSNYIIVEVESKEKLEGTIRRVKIIGSDEEKLIGELY